MQGVSFVFASIVVDEINLKNYTWIGNMKNNITHPSKAEGPSMYVV
jgi:hypothetical protein